VKWSRVTYRRGVGSVAAGEMDCARVCEAATSLNAARSTTVPIDSPGFYDWVGVAALEEDIAEGAPLEDLVGLLGDRWIVVGIDIHPQGSRNRAEEGSPGLGR